MKQEWKKHEKELYHVRQTPSLLTVPRQQFVTIDGAGDPNEPEFAEKVGVLYALSYTLKMRYKASSSDLQGQQGDIACTDYTVYPLEGTWTSSTGDPLDKSSYVYTIMIRQPDVVTQHMYEQALSIVEKKKGVSLAHQVKFRSAEDGLTVQMLHIGPFDDEPASFEQMDKFATHNGVERLDHVHREIYLSDMNKTAPAKLRTILRYRVKQE